MTTHVDFTTPGFVRPRSEASRFFYEHAAPGYCPNRETPEEGRWRGAESLARAEREAEARGWLVQWERDYDGDYMDADTEWHDWPHYWCQMYDPETGDTLASLCGVMFADRGGPEGDPYSRVVAAELAEEALG